MTLAGADAASVTIPEHDSYRTVGPTTASASQVDQAQYHAGEGPCLDAISASLMVTAPSFPDERWPILGASPTEYGVQSSISYQLKERTSLQRLDKDLEQALLSRDVIGQAKGILMERLKTTPEQAFEILKNASQRLNVKLRQVARDITETGELGPSDPRSAR